jgi:hypothetical protein
VTPPALFSRGDYVRVKRGNVHVVVSHPRPGRLWLTVACGRDCWLDALTPASGDEPRQCPKCREAT